MMDKKVLFIFSFSISRSFRALPDPFLRIELLIRLSYVVTSVLARMMLFDEN
jgi:hypothetical protein